MAQIEGLNQVALAIQAYSRRLNDIGNGSAIVAYTQGYAVMVHEVNRNYRNGQWKYLETPAREKQDEISEAVSDATRLTGSLKKGLIAGGLRLQRESQKLVPVDTGALKASAVTSWEE